MHSKCNYLYYFNRVNTHDVKSHTPRNGNQKTKQDFPLVLKQFAKLKEKSTNDGYNGQYCSDRGIVARIASCRFIRRWLGCGSSRCCRYIRCCSWQKRNGLVVALVTSAAHYVTIQQHRRCLHCVKVNCEDFTAFCYVCSNEMTPEDNYCQESIK